MPNSTDAARIDTPGHTSIRTPSTRATMPISSCGTHISRSGFGVAVVVIAVTFHLAGSSMLAAPARAVIGTKGHQKSANCHFCGSLFFGQNADDAHRALRLMSPMSIAAHQPTTITTSVSGFGRWEWGIKEVPMILDV